MSEICHICFPGTIQKWFPALNRYPFPDKGYLIIVNIEFSNFETFITTITAITVSYRHPIRRFKKMYALVRGGEKKRSKLLKCHYFCSFCIENTPDQWEASLPIETASKECLPAAEFPLSQQLRAAQKSTVGAHCCPAG